MSKIDKKGSCHRSQLTRVNKIEGQVRGIRKMIDEGKYCVDILTQVKAARSALKSLELLILETHLNNCLLTAASSGSIRETQEKIDEILNLLKKTSKS